MTYRSFVLAIAAVGFVCVADPADTAQGQPTSIVGAWTLNKERSDLPPAEPQPGEREGRGRFGGPDDGGRRGGGFGGGRGGGGFGGVRGGRGNPEEMQRRRDAVRAILEAPERMTITSAGSMVIITAGDGRTTRLATDGSKVKDESTGIERKTRWEGDRLVSEISGAGRGKIVETYALAPESHQLIVSLQMDGGNGRQPDPRRRVYEPQQP